MFEWTLKLFVISTIIGLFTMGLLWVSNYALIALGVPPFSPYMGVFLYSMLSFKWGYLDGKKNLYNI